MVQSANTASKATAAKPSGDTCYSTGHGAEFESVLSSFEEDRFEVKDDRYTTNQSEEESTEDSESSTEEVSETDLYNTLMEIMQRLLAEARFQSIESEVGPMQESLDEKLKKLNELVSTMKSGTSGEPIFDLSAFNTDESKKNENQRVVLQQMLKETTALNNFTDVDKQQLSNLTSILNSELSKKTEITENSNVLKIENGVLKVGNNVLKVENGVLKLEPETVQVETNVRGENLSNQLRVDQLFHTLRSNVGQEASVSSIPRPADQFEDYLSSKKAKGTRAELEQLLGNIKTGIPQPDVKSPVGKSKASSPLEQLASHLSPEKLESAKSALEHLMQNVQTGPNLQTGTTNVDAGIDSRSNRVMSTQILPRIQSALKAGEMNFKMMLSPHGLGQVEVQMFLEEGKLKVNLAASSSATAELLASQADDLKKALGTKDIQISYSGHNQDFTEEKNSALLNNFLNQKEGRKGREGNSQNSEQKGKSTCDIGERVEAKLVNPKLREGNLLGRI